MENPEALADTIVLYGDAETELAQFPGKHINRFYRLNDASFVAAASWVADGHTEYEFVCVRDGVLSDELDSLSPTLDSAQISVFGEKLCYIQDRDETSYFTTVRADGSTVENEFHIQTEKLDSFCLTGQGILASMSTKSGHKYVLMAPDGSRTTLERPGNDAALYRLTASGSSVLAVDPYFHLYAITAQDGQIQLWSDVFGDLPDSDDQAVSFFSGTDDSFYLLYSGNRLFRLTAAPEA